MNRIDRLMGMVTVLQAKKYVLAEFLAEKFNISVRTVYRDIKALNEINIPVSFEANKGYFVVQGFFLPPVAFTTEEANALILVEVIAHKFSDQSIKKHYATALTKVKSVLRGSQKDKIENLNTQIATLDSAGWFKNDYAWLSDIQNAIMNKTILSMTYQSYQKQTTEREIEPIGIVYYAMNWHIIAWCWKRKDYRDFNASRILKLINTSTPFRKTGHIDLSDYIKTIESFFKGLP